MLFILYKIYPENLYLTKNSLYKKPLFLRETARRPEGLNVASIESAKKYHALNLISSRKQAYIILTPLNPTFM